MNLLVSYFLFLTTYLFYSYCSNSFTPQPLQIGTHDYVDVLGNPIRIELIPVRTMYRGLCYTVKSSNPLPLNSMTRATLNPNYFVLHVSSSIQGIDKLGKINLLIAANNTWQGIVGNTWPHKG